MTKLIIWENATSLYGFTVGEVFPVSQVMPYSSETTAYAAFENSEFSNTGCGPA